MHKILIIDDSKPLQQLLMVQLGTDDFSFETAGNGTDALRRAAIAQPDLILLDVDLPDMNGFDVCRFLKADSRTAQIPIIFLTASASADERVCGMELKATDFITKPFDSQDLNDRVRSVLREQRLSAMLSGEAASSGFAIH